MSLLVFRRLGAALASLCAAVALLLANTGLAGAATTPHRLPQHRTQPPLITHTPLRDAHSLRAPIPEIATCPIPDWSPSLGLSSGGQFIDFGLMGLSESCEPDYGVTVTLVNRLFIDQTGNGGPYVQVASSLGFDVTLPPAVNVNDTGVTPYQPLLAQYGANAGVFDQATWTFLRTNHTNWGPLPNSPECSAFLDLLTCTTYSPEYSLG